MENRRILIDTSIIIDYLRSKNRNNSNSLIFIILFLFSIHSQAHENGLNPDVKGGYRKCTVLYYDYKNSVFDSNSVRIYEIIHYNENGVKIRNIQYLLLDYPRLFINYIYYTNCDIKIETELDIDGNIEKYYFYEFNHNGELVSSIDIDSELNLENHKVVDIDESELLKREFSFDKNNYIESYKLTMLNLKGDPILIQTYDSNNNMKEQLSLEYDSSGNMIECRDGIDSNLTNTILAKYDENGNIIEEISCDSKNDTNYHTIHVINLTENYTEIIDLKGYRIGYKSRIYRDDKGNKIKWIFYNGENEIENTRFYYYDAENRIIGYTILKDGSISHKETYEYDKYGNLTKHSYYDSDDKVSSEYVYIYEY